jgi:hypothetical protein
MVAVWCEKPVEYRSQVDPRDPVVLFDLESLGIKSGVFLNDFHKSFSTLPWDYYDVRREQLKQLEAALATHEKRELLFADYYRGTITLPELLSHLPEQSAETLAIISGLEPYRRRTTSRFALEYQDSDWYIARVKNAPVVQTVPSSDYRSLSRVFPETSVEIVEHPEFSKLLSSLGNLVLQADDTVGALQITVWQTGIIATPYRTGTNAPEGIHQDGSDYIVSALVTARDNIQGGVSRVFAEDKTTEILSVTLQPGQGIFQADSGSSLWHDVTPIRVENTREGNGTRNLFGFDIDVAGRG